MCGNIVDGVLVDDVKPQIHATNKDHSWENYSKKNLFKRQENWVPQREQKRLAAKLKIDAEHMRGVTGKPDLAHTTDPWRKAQDIHDEVLKKTTEEEE